MLRFWNHRSCLCECHFYFIGQYFSATHSMYAYCGALMDDFIATQASPALFVMSCTLLLSCWLLYNVAIPNARVQLHRLTYYNILRSPLCHVPGTLLAKLSPLRFDNRQKFLVASPALRLNKTRNRHTKRVSEFTILT